MASNLTSRVIKALGILGGVQAVGVLCSLARTKVIALCMGAAGIGLNAIYNTAFTILSTLSESGLRNSTVRDISQSHAAELSMTAYVVRRWCLWLGVGGALLMAILSPWFSILYFNDYLHALWFVLMAPAITMTVAAAGEQALMQGTGRLRLLARTATLTAVAGTVAGIPLYIYMGYDSIPLVILLFSSAMWLGAHIWRVRVPRPDVRPTTHEVISRGRRFISLGIYMTASLFITQGAMLAFITYLQTQGGAETVGWYQAGFVLVNQYIGLLFTAMALEYYPRLAGAVHSVRATALYVTHEINVTLTALIAPAVIFIVLNVPILHLLYDSSFECLTPFVIFAVVGTVFRAISWCIAIVMIARGDGRIYIVTEVLSDAVYLAVSIAMYRLGGIACMGYAYIIWYAIYTVIVTAVYTRRYGMRVAPASWAICGVAVTLTGVTALTYTYVSIYAAVAVAILSSAWALRRLIRLTGNKKRR